MQTTESFARSSPWKSGGGEEKMALRTHRSRPASRRVRRKPGWATGRLAPDGRAIKNVAYRRRVQFCRMGWYAEAAALRIIVRSVAPPGRVRRPESEPVGGILHGPLAI